MQRLNLNQLTMVKCMLVLSCFILMSQAKRSNDEQVQPAEAVSVPLKDDAQVSGSNNAEQAVDATNGPVGLTAGEAQGITVQPMGMVISDGTRIHVAEKSFSIIPPAGWEVHRDYPGTTLLFQIPRGESKVYQRTIQVNAMNGARAIDDITAKEFEDLILKNFTKGNPAITEYKIRNHVFIDLPTGNKGILYYVEFNLNDRPMMQTHILVSSEARHFLLTYTDIAENFEKGSESPFLTTAWQSMTSIEVGSDSPGRFSGAIQVVVIIGTVLFGGVLFSAIRRRRAQSAYRKMAEDLNDYGDHDSAVSKHDSMHSEHFHEKLKRKHAPTTNFSDHDSKFSEHEAKMSEHEAKSKPASTLNTQSLHEEEYVDETWSGKSKRKNKAG